MIPSESLQERRHVGTAESADANVLGSQAPGRPRKQPMFKRSHLLLLAFLVVVLLMWAGLIMTFTSSSKAKRHRSGAKFPLVRASPRLVSIVHPKTAQDKRLLEQMAGRHGLVVRAKGIAEPSLVYFMGGKKWIPEKALKHLDIKMSREEFQQKYAHEEVDDEDDTDSDSSEAEMEKEGSEEEKDKEKGNEESEGEEKESGRGGNEIDAKKEEAGKEEKGEEEERGGKEQEGGDKVEEREDKEEGKKEEEQDDDKGKEKGGKEEEEEKEEGGKGEGEGGKKVEEEEVSAGSDGEAESKADGEEKKKRFRLSLHSHIPKHKAACPFPALHPHKWRKKFGWGEPAGFPRCDEGMEDFTVSIAKPQGGSRDAVTFKDPRKGKEIRFFSIGSELHYSVDGEDRGAFDQVTYDAELQALRLLGRGVKLPPGEVDEILVALGDLFDRFGVRSNLPVDLEVNCDAQALVIEFPELEDSHFQRLSTVIGAEHRQNELRRTYTTDALFGAKGVRKHEVVDGRVRGLTRPYFWVHCGDKRRLLININRQKPRERKSKRETTAPGSKLNVMHVMFDSTSLAALIRACPRITKALETLNNRPDSPSNVFSFKHFHSVSCCSPGNQIPMYSGRMNGEYNPFVRAEPQQKSKNWLWNIAHDLGYKTFWSLDNCPDKSARDFQAWPKVDHRVVAPTCLAGVLLSHKTQTCLGGRPIDHHIFDGLKQFWKMYPRDPKYAAVQFITPHEETEKLLIELDKPMSAFLEWLEQTGSLNNTVVVFFADHGINFGRYASTHDGQIEKMFPFLHILAPRWAPRDLINEAALRHNMDAVVTPYDVHQAIRRVLYHPSPPPPYTIDPEDPPLPRPEESHIVASMKTLRPFADILSNEVPLSRTCTDANIPPEFCTCLPWAPEHNTEKYQKQVEHVLESHRKQLKDLEQCAEIVLDKVVAVDLQVWPTEYHPKEQAKAKKIWMEPNRDMLRIEYKTKPPGDGVFEAVLSLEKSDYSRFEIATLTRLDAMKKKCGVLEKSAELLCVCL